MRKVQIFNPFQSLFAETVYTVKFLMLNYILFELFLIILLSTQYAISLTKVMELNNLTKKNFLLKFNLLFTKTVHQLNVVYFEI